MVSPYYQLPKKTAEHLLHVQISGSALGAQFARAGSAVDSEAQAKLEVSAVVKRLRFAFV